ncbi:MAG: FAD-dependent oxidoreductase [Actinomycetota bacterium]|nr:FAD-dependent oxidoreductase [Actinomycetota bacterium]
MSQQHESVWMATSEGSDHQPLDGPLEVDVAIVGAGITGLTTALLLQRQGRRVAVMEMARIGTGTTGHTTGKLTSLHGLTYVDLVKKHGREKARLYGEANQAAIDQVGRLAGELGVDCRFRRASAFTYTASPKHRSMIEEEVATAVELGLPAALVEGAAVPFPVEAAVRFDNQAHLHPRRYCLGLARRIVADGGHLFEQTRALDVDERLDHAVVRTQRGDVTAAQVVLATLLPFVDLGGFFAKARPTRSYGLALRLRHAAPEGMWLSVESPTRSTRPWPDGGPEGLIVVGESHPTGHDEDTKRYYDDLEQWARSTFDVEAVEHRWSAQDYMTADSVPYVGRSPRMAHTLVATGFKKWGLSNGTAAAMILADLVAGRDNPWLAVFDATRIGDAQTVKKLVEENLHVGKRFVEDRLTRLRAPEAAHLRPGQGGIVEADGATVGAYRDREGDLHAVSLTCRHMGCSLRWNSAETSWDCPCHGSRYSYTGRLLNGPAVEDLPVIQVDQRQ